MGSCQRWVNLRVKGTGGVIMKPFSSTGCLKQITRLGEFPSSLAAMELALGTPLPDQEAPGEWGWVSNLDPNLCP